MTIDAYSVGTTVVYRTPDGNTGSGAIVAVLVTLREDMHIIITEILRTLRTLLPPADRTLQ